MSIFVEFANRDFRLRERAKRDRERGRNGAAAAAASAATTTATTTTRSTFVEEILCIHQPHAIYSFVVSLMLSMRYVNMRCMAITKFVDKFPERMLLFGFIVLLLALNNQAKRTNERTDQASEPTHLSPFIAFILR